MAPSTIEKLHAAIDERPDDAATYQVLADHLIELGDPRGELIHLDGKPGKDRFREREVLQDRLGPELHPASIWRHGYVRHFHETVEFEAASELRARLAHPSLRHATSIDLEFVGSFQDRRQWLVDLIAEAPRPALRSLTLRGNTPELTDLSLAKLWTEHLPRLEEVHVNARFVTLGKPASPTLLVLDIAAGIEHGDLEPLFEARLPALRELRFEAEEDGALLAKLRASPLGERLGDHLIVEPIDPARYDRCVE